MDLFGPVSLMSINHEKYTLVIVDEYSRYTWVYFIKKKSQALDMIMSFIRLIENQNDVKVKQIRTDNGTEYESNEFNDFCRESGIKRGTTTTYTLKQNGVAERNNLTITEATCAMIHDQSLPKFFWVEVANTALYV